MGNIYNSIELSDRGIHSMRVHFAHFTPPPCQIQDQLGMALGMAPRQYQQLKRRAGALELM